MKRIVYANFWQGQSSVDYEIFDGYICVFCGVTCGGTSTVNAAERIVKAIAEAEKVPLKFYDLQTRQGYEYFQPGEYEFNLLVVTDQEEPQVTRWIPEPLPPEVLEAFREHIGPDPRQRD